LVEEAQALFVLLSQQPPPPSELSGKYHLLIICLRTFFGVARASTVAQRKSEASLATWYWAIVRFETFMYLAAS
jgi:hypothetical protein